MPLCLTIIELEKASDSVETEVVVEAFDNQGIPTQYIKLLRELCSNFTPGISPFYKNIVIDLPSRTNEVKVDGWQPHRLRLADDIVLITPSISQAERMLNGTNISECTSNVYLDRELNIMNDLTPELARRR
ncbi:hypothetical protein RB195_013124 [Necator americanus]|uniref:Reverse transcriptase domain-containing protein n=1 Tax=Necator americanus TaxID=51031 RepID=A0ABR1DU36_NECAM